MEEWAFLADNTAYDQWNVAGGGIVVWLLLPKPDDSGPSFC